MIEEPDKTLQDLVAHVGRYPEEAFVFIREGLSYASNEIHGKETDTHRALQGYLAKHDLDWNDLVGQYHTGELPEPVREAIDSIGGCDNLNRHVSGRELCWALRDYALKRWGILARVVLESWNVKNTHDFGRIVFGFIDLDLMRKQEDDHPDDFKDVYTFAEAFEEPFRSGLPSSDRDASEQ